MFCVKIKKPDRSVPVAILEVCSFVEDLDLLEWRADLNNDIFAVMPNRLGNVVKFYARKRL